MTSLALQPISQAEARAFVRQHHRHAKPDQGAKFCIGVSDGKNVVGVAVVGRPRARHLDDGWTVEVTRLCTDGTRNVVSKLMRGVKQTCAGMGYRRLITYTLESEGGASMRASGMKLVALRDGGRSWNCQSRPRVDTSHPDQKALWECAL